MPGSRAWSRATIPPAVAADLAVAPSVYPVRQTVAFGPVTAGGLPDFLPATSASLALTSQNLATSALAVVAANGKDTRVGTAAANLTWASLSANATNFLYVDVAANGALTAGSTTVAPAYQNGGSFSNTAGAFVFDISQMKGHLGSGAANAQAWRVYVGEAITNGTTVTSTIAYAYQGRFSSGWAAFAANTLYTYNHRLGCYPRQVAGYLSNKADGVCSAGGDIVVPISATGYADSSTSGTKALWLDRNALKARVKPNMLYLTATDGTTEYATDAGVYASFIVSRGW